MTHPPAPLIGLQATLQAPPGVTATSSSGTVFDVSLLVWQARPYGVDLYVHGKGRAALIPEVERDQWPHPGLWFDELAKGIEQGATS